MALSIDLNVGTYQGCSIRGDIEAAFAVVEAILSKAAARILDLVLFPELFLSG